MEIIFVLFAQDIFNAIYKYLASTLNLRPSISHHPFHISNIFPVQTEEMRNIYYIMANTSNYKDVPSKLFIEPINTQYTRTFTSKCIHYSSRRCRVLKWTHFVVVLVLPILNFCRWLVRGTFAVCSSHVSDERFGTLIWLVNAYRCNAIFFHHAEYTSGLFVFYSQF